MKVDSARRAVALALLLPALLPAACGEPGALRVYVGYANSSSGKPPVFPSPWAGAPGVRFVGSAGRIDAGALRIDNPTGGEVRIDGISVSAGGRDWALWGAQRIPARSTLILTRTAATGPGAFRTAEAGGSCSDPDNAVARIRLALNGRTVELRDTGRVLTTGGRDLAACPGSPNGSRQWTSLGSVPLEAPGPPGSVSPETLVMLASLPLVLGPIVLGMLGAGLQLLVTAFRSPRPPSPSRPRLV